MPLIDYTGSEGDRYQDNRFQDGQAFVENKWVAQAWAKYARIIYLSSIKKGACVLEVGAGYGRNLSEIQKEAEVIAVEPAPKARAYCQSLGLTTFSKLEEIPEEMRFDHILLRHVLEHVPEPKAFVEMLSRQLAPEGELIVVLPVESAYAAPKAEDRDFHLYSWTRQTASNFLKDCGYRVTACDLHWFNGRKFFIWIYRFLGIGFYARTIQTAGRLRGVCEIVIKASKAKNP